MRVLPFLPLAVLLLLAAWFGAALLRGHDEAPPSALLDKPLPPAIAAALGPLPARPLLVNVFADWCAPCAAEHPQLMALAPDIPLYGIAWKAPEPALSAWLQQRGDPYARRIADLDGRLGLELGITGVPETFLLDAAGRVRARHAGPLDAATAAELRRMAGGGS